MRMMCRVFQPRHRSIALSYVLSKMLYVIREFDTMLARKIISPWMSKAKLAKNPSKPLEFTIAEPSGDESVY